MQSGNLGEFDHSTYHNSSNMGGTFNQEQMTFNNTGKNEAHVPQSSYEMSLLAQQLAENMIKKQNVN